MSLGVNKMDRPKSPACYSRLYFQPCLQKGEGGGGKEGEGKEWRNV